MTKKRDSKKITNNKKAKPTLKEEEIDFIKRYSLLKDDYTKAKINVGELNKIEKEYRVEKDGLMPIANSVLEALRNVEGVHSLRMRIKKPAHLIEKLIRKQIEDKALEITFNNYDKYIGDKIGIRVLHLFKTDWFKIHDFITEKWDLYETPCAYIRKGDSDDVYKGKKCNVEIHEKGYRSVHYLIKTKPMKEEISVEIQVRTLFEEGWSEIDHLIRYPYNLSSTILNEYLSIFNRLAGSADEMGSFILLLKNSLENQNKAEAKIQAELKRKNDELNKAISKLKISETEKQNLEEKVKNLSTPDDRFAKPFLLDSSAIQDANVPFIFNVDKSVFTTPPPPKCRECGKELNQLYLSINQLCDDCSIRQSFIR